MLGFKNIWTYNFYIEHPVWYS